MNPKNLALTFAAISALSFILIANYGESVQGTRPIDPKVCDAVDYTLNFVDLTVAADIIPGQPDRLDAFFTSASSGNIALMTLEVYKFNVKIHTIKSETNLDFNSTDQLDYIYQVVLPKFIPHINVTIHMNWFDATGKLLSCIKYDLHL